MRTKEELNKLYAAKVLEVEEKLKAAGDSPLSEEERNVINAIYGEIDDIKAELHIVERLGKDNSYLDEPQGTEAAHLGFRESGPREGDLPVDEKAWRSFEIKTMTPRGIEQKEIRYQVPLAVQVKGYEGAFESYLRHGKEDLGPNDRKALVEALDASGGYTVPEDMQTSLLKKIATMATVRMFARIVTTSRDSIKWPRIKYTTDNKYTSAFRMTWTGETPSSATAHRVTDQVFGEFNIPVNTGMASQLISADLIADSAFDVFGLSSEMLGEAFALGENVTFWTGNGAGQPRGIITDASDTTNFDAAVTVAVTGDTIEADDVIDTIYALPAQYEYNARVFMTKATEKLIRKIKDSSSDYIWPVQALVGGFGVAANELLGFPTTRDEFVNNVSDSDNTTTYPLVFGDLNAYAIVDRVGLSIKRDDSLYSETNNVLLLGKKRVGGQLVEAYRLSLLRTVNST